MAKSPLLVHGMHGMGDNLHQRAIIRQLMQTHDVWLETSWASLYHDMIADGLKLRRRHVALRTQTKNANRASEVVQFSGIAPPRGCDTMAIRYGANNISATASKTILEAMCRSTGCDYTKADFRLPVPEQWRDEARKWFINRSGKPLLIYRPLVERTEWLGSAARNADALEYARLFAEIRDKFFVVSVADLDPPREQIVGPVQDADVTLHHGELTFEALAGLFSLAELVFTSSGFAAILAPAVGTAVISVVGGYESANYHATGARFAPYLGIEPPVPCRCQNSRCGRRCNKHLNMPVALERVREFIYPMVLGCAPVGPITDYLPHTQPSEICIQTSDKIDLLYDEHGPCAPAPR